MIPHNKKRVIWVLILVLSILFLETLHAQSSENYQLIKSAITQGGAQSQSADYQAFDAVGQSAAVCTTQSTNYTIYSGFFNIFLKFFLLFPGFVINYLFHPVNLVILAVLILY